MLKKPIFTRDAIEAIEHECLQFGPFEVTKEQAIREYKRNSFPAECLISDLGDEPRYRAAEVLLALGY